MDKINTEQDDLVHLGEIQLPTYFPHQIDDNDDPAKKVNFPLDRSKCETAVEGEQSSILIEKSSAALENESDEPKEKRQRMDNSFVQEEKEIKQPAKSKESDPKENQDEEPNDDTNVIDDIVSVSSFIVNKNKLDQCVTPEAEKLKEDNDIGGDEVLDMKVSNISPEKGEGSLQCENEIESIGDMFGDESGEDQLEAIQEAVKNLINDDELNDSIDWNTAFDDNVDSENNETEDEGEEDDADDEETEAETSFEKEPDTNTNAFEENQNKQDDSYIDSLPKDLSEVCKDIEAVEETGTSFAVNMDTSSVQLINSKTPEKLLQKDKEKYMIEKGCSRASFTRENYLRFKQNLKLGSSALPSKPADKGWKKNSTVDEPQESNENILLQNELPIEAPEAAKECNKKDCESSVSEDQFSDSDSDHHDRLIGNEEAILSEVPAFELLDSPKKSNNKACLAMTESCSLELQDESSDDDIETVFAEMVSKAQVKKEPVKSEPHSFEVGKEELSSPPQVQRLVLGTKLGLNRLNLHGFTPTHSGLLTPNASVTQHGIRVHLPQNQQEAGLSGYQYPNAIHSYLPKSQLAAPTAFPFPQVPSQQVRPQHLYASEQTLPGNQQMLYQPREIKQEVKQEPLLQVFHSPPISNTQRQEFMQSKNPLQYPQQARPPSQLRTDQYYNTSVPTYSRSSSVLTEYPDDQPQSEFTKMNQYKKYVNMQRNHPNSFSKQGANNYNQLMSEDLMEEKHLAEQLQKHEQQYLNDQNDRQRLQFASNKNMMYKNRQIPLTVQGGGDDVDDDDIEDNVDDGYIEQTQSLHMDNDGRQHITTNVPQTFQQPNSLAPYDTSGQGTLNRNLQNEPGYILPPKQIRDLEPKRKIIYHRIGNRELLAQEYEEKTHVTNLGHVVTVRKKTFTSESEEEITIPNSKDPDHYGSLLDRTTAGRNYNRPKKFLQPTFKKIAKVDEEPSNISQESNEMSSRDIASASSLNQNIPLEVLKANETSSQQYFIPHHLRSSTAPQKLDATIRNIRVSETPVVTNTQTTSSDKSLYSPAIRGNKFSYLSPALRRNTNAAEKSKLHLNLGNAGCSNAELYSPVIPLANRQEERKSTSSNMLARVVTVSSNTNIQGSQKVLQAQEPASQIFAQNNYVVNSAGQGGRKVRNSYGFSVVSPTESNSQITRSFVVMPSPNSADQYTKKFPPRTQSNAPVITPTPSPSPVQNKFVGLPAKQRPRCPTPTPDKVLKTVRVCGQAALQEQLQSLLSTAHGPVRLQFPTGFKFPIQEGSMNVAGKKAQVKIVTASEARKMGIALPFPSKSKQSEATKSASQTTADESHSVKSEPEGIFRRNQVDGSVDDLSDSEHNVESANITIQVDGLFDTSDSEQNSTSANNSIKNKSNTTHTNTQQESSNVTGEEAVQSKNLIQNSEENMETDEEQSNKKARHLTSTCRGKFIIGSTEFDEDAMDSKETVNIRFSNVSHQDMVHDIKMLNAPANNPSRELPIPIRKPDDKNENTYQRVRLVSRPWKTPEGTVNRPTLRMMLSAVMTYIMSKPGISLEGLENKYEKVLQPVPLLELIDMLITIGCIKRLELHTSGQPSLFSKRSTLTLGPDREITEGKPFYLPTVDCLIKFGQFEQQLKGPSNG